MQGKVLTVASGKGGVGKTTTAVNLAVALWREGSAVALVDADLGMANLAAVLGLEPEATLHDILSGDATPEEAVIEAKGGDLLVLPGEQDLTGFANADPAELQSVLDDLADRCDYVIVDTGAGLSYEDVLPLGLADEVILVTTPDPAAIGDTSKTLELSGLLDGPVRGVVVTRALENTDPDSIAAEIGVDLLATIPEDPAVTESVSRGDPLESHAPDALATLAYRDLATTLVNAAPLVADTSGEEPEREADASVVAADGAPTDTTVEEPADAVEEPTDGPDYGVSDSASSGDTDDVAEEPDEVSRGPADGDDDSTDTEEAVDAVDEEAATADEPPDETEEPGEEAAETEDETGESEDEAPETPDEADVSKGDEADVTEESEEDDAEAETEEDDEAADEAKRGGFFGWLGRLFS